ncbi:PP2C family protein-serine/threonine phosphatase [Pseudonocardia adelaidensis]|uniref:PP2C family protein-serine/threonine phosphatase n=1 Tax=Pseudonocardia adelaidensis TaxID=648754 RepID=A0ABP9NTG5_9PSEU
MLARVVDEAHLTSGDQLSALVDGAVRPLGLGADVLVADLAQRVLTPVGTTAVAPLNVVGTLAGHAYQMGEILAGTDHSDGVVLWTPIAGGGDRTGVLRVALGEGVVDDLELRQRLWTLAGLVNYIVTTKLAYSDRLRRLRSAVPLSAASELLWQLLPPRTFATDRVVVSALLEPCARVAGDAYDYNAEDQVVDLAVFDAAGHDINACLTTALAITGIRNGRRAGETDLVALAERADELIIAQHGPVQFATAVLTRLDTEAGILEYLIAGHPAPLLIRGGQVVKELPAPARAPLSVRVPRDEVPVVMREQLEPGDQVLMYTDGITEARDADGEFFGEKRLVEFAEHAAAAQLSAPETLRRLLEAVLDHQGGKLQDDASLLLVDWDRGAHARMFPGLAHQARS